MFVFFRSNFFFFFWVELVVMVTSLHAGGEIHHTFLQEPYLNACYIVSSAFVAVFPSFPSFWL